MTSARTPPRLEGRVAIVSGGARGIGEAHVRALAGEGAHVVIGDVLLDRGAALAEELGERARAVPFDVTSEEHWTAAVAAAEQQMAAKYPLRRFGTPEEVARTMLFIVCDAAHATGDAVPIDGGILAGIMMGE